MDILWLEIVNDKDNRKSLHLAILRPLPHNDQILMVHIVQTVYLTIAKTGLPISRANPRNLDSRSSIYITSTGYDHPILRSVSIGH